MPVSVPISIPPPQTEMFKPNVPEPTVSNNTAPVPRPPTVAQLTTLNIPTPSPKPIPRPPPRTEMYKPSAPQPTGSSQEKKAKLLQVLTQRKLEYDRANPTISNVSAPKPLPDMSQIDTRPSIQDLEKTIQGQYKTIGECEQVYARNQELERFNADMSQKAKQMESTIQGQYKTIGGCQKVQADNLELSRQNQAINQRLKELEQKYTLAHNQAHNVAVSCEQKMQNAQSMINDLNQQVAQVPDLKQIIDSMETAHEENTEIRKELQAELNNCHQKSKETDNIYRDKMAERDKLIVTNRALNKENENATEALEQINDRNEKLRSDVARQNARMDNMEQSFKEQLNEYEQEIKRVQQLRRSDLAKLNKLKKYIKKYEDMGCGKIYRSTLSTATKQSALEKAPWIKR